MALLIVGWALLCQLANNKSPTDMPIGKSDGNSSSIEALPFPLCQVDNETNQAEFIIFLTILSHRAVALGVQMLTALT